MSAASTLEKQFSLGCRLHQGELSETYAEKKVNSIWFSVCLGRKQERQNRRYGAGPWRPYPRQQKKSLATARGRFAA